MITLRFGRVCWAVTALFLAGRAAETRAAWSYFPGNGHWYEAVQVPAGITWDEANTNAINGGGHLCTITNAAENTFVASLVDLSFYSGVSVNGDILGPWLGGFRHANQSNWQWVTGEAFSYVNWYPNQPDGYGGSEQRLQFYARNTIGSTWGDHPGGILSGYSLPRGYIVEREEATVLTAVLSNADVVVSWPIAFSGWTLEWTPGPLADSTVWSPVPRSQYVTNATSMSLTLPNSAGPAFFRLKQ